MTCGERDQPIVHNFPVNGEMIPVASLIHILPEDILWDDVDIDTAPMLQEGSSHRWWTRAITLDDEAHAYSHFIKEYRDKAPPGALTFIHTDKFLEAAVVVNEAVDPRGHRISLLDTGCYMNYFIRYIHEKPFSGTHFFEGMYQHLSSTIDYHGESFSHTMRFQSDFCHFFEEEMVTATSLLLFLLCIRYNSSSYHVR